MRDIAPINHATIREDVYELLRRGILSQDYPPGFRFDLNDLSARLRVSRTPVKEALHRLETEGLVTIYPRRGTYVATLDPHDIADGYGVRLALERFAAESIVRTVTDADIARLWDARREMRRLLDAPDFSAVVDTFISLDQDFHVAIMALSRNRRLVEIYKTVGGPLHMARILSRFGAPDYMNYTEPEHDAIMQAIERRDGAALADAMAAHIERAKVRVLHGFGGQ